MARVRPSAARPFLTLAMTLGLLGAAVASSAQEVGSIHFTAGFKNLTSDWALGGPEINAVGDTLAHGRQNQPALGVDLTWGRKTWPVQLAMDVIHSYDDGLQRFPEIDLGPLQIPAADARREARTIELGLGVRRSWNVSGFEPTLGGGGVWVRGSVLYSMSDPHGSQFGAPFGVPLGGSDSGFGFWVDGGVYRHLGPRFELGIRGRFSKAKLVLPEATVMGANGGYYFRGNPVEVEGGGRHLAFVMGWSFPTRP